MVEDLGFPLPDPLPRGEGDREREVLLYVAI
jgi:hypothetical protein